jgi:hypothetical protein
VVKHDGRQTSVIIALVLASCLQMQALLLLSPFALAPRRLLCSPSRLSQRGKVHVTGTVQLGRV